MMKVFFVLVFIISTFSMSSVAKSLELTKNNKSIFIVEKNDWKLGRDLFGMPFIYFSPESNGQRSNISFTDTGAEIELDINSLSSSQKSYEEGRKAWAEKVGATSLSFVPYKVQVNKHGHRVHSIGFSYTHEGKSYLEKSHYIECRGKLIFSKSLRLVENEKHDNDFFDLIQSLDCGGV